MNTCKRGGTKSKLFCTESKLPIKVSIHQKRWKTRDSYTLESEQGGSLVKSYPHAKGIILLKQ